MGGLVRRVCGVWCADNYWTKSDLTLPIDVCRISKMVLPWMTSPETINTDTSTDSAQPESSGRAREYPCEFRACYQVISWSLVCCVQSLSIRLSPSWPAFCLKILWHQEAQYGEIRDSGNLYFSTVQILVVPYLAKRGLNMPLAI